MIGITLSPEQVRAAPPEVRRWIEKELASSLGFLAQVERQLQHTHAELTACSHEEALQLFDLIREDYLASQVFFELGRDNGNDSSALPLHALSIGEIMRHTRIHSGEHLLRYLGVINDALQRIRQDASIRMFGFDEDGHCYIHEETHRNIGRVWHEFLTSQVQRSADPEPAAASQQMPIAPPAPWFNASEPRPTTHVADDPPAVFSSSAS